MEIDKNIDNVEQSKPSKKLKTLNSYTGKLKLLEISAWALLILYLSLIHI